MRRKLKRVKIHREGTGILYATLLCLLALNILVWWLSRPAGIGLTAISIIIYGLLVNFFRSPKRKFLGNTENVVVSSVEDRKSVV